MLASPEPCSLVAMILNRYSSQGYKSVTSALSTLPSRKDGAETRHNLIHFYYLVLFLKHIAVVNRAVRLSKVLGDVALCWYTTVLTGASVPPVILI